MDTTDGANTTSPSTAAPRETTPTPGAAAAPSPAAEASTSASASGSASTSAASVQVFRPADDSNSPSPVPDSFFDHSISDVQSYHASVLSRSRQLNDAPLLTAKHRDEAAAEREKKKADKWPTTTIRIKFSDGTQIQRVFPSTSPIQPVYAFVRESLSDAARSKEFTLYQPPRSMFPEKPAPEAAGAGAKGKAAHPNPAMNSRVISPAGYNVRGNPMAGMQGGTGRNESLSQLGLVPQSVLLIKWADADLNATGVPAPLTAALLSTAAPLPKPQAKAAPEQKEPSAAKKLTGAVGDVKMPKWLQKGLMKKK